MRESGLERKITEYVREKGGTAYKWVSPGRAGVPDRICIFPGGFIVFVEVKRPGLKDGLSPRQVKEIERLRSLGCKVYRVSDFERFKEIADGIPAV